MRSRRRHLVNFLTRTGGDDTDPPADGQVCSEASGNNVDSRVADAEPTRRPRNHTPADGTKLVDETQQARGTEQVAFPSRKKKKNNASRRPSPHAAVNDNEPRGIVERFRHTLYRPKFLLLLACGLSAIVFGPQLYRRLPDPGAREGYQLDTTNIDITPPPRDVPPDIVHQVIQQAELPASVSLLDDDLTRRIADAFAAHPWVAEVVSVRKSFPPRIQVQLKYRKPVAMVRVDDGIYPVDGESVLLPPQDFSMADTRRYPLIRGVQTLPQGPAGSPWGDVCVQGAARLAAALQKDWNALQLAAIQVPRRTAARERLDDLRFVLHCRHGSRIIWGRPPGTQHPGELTTEQKIGRLKQYRDDFGEFDQPHGPYEIDIRHWQEITRRPLSASRESRRRRR